jgi:hypothetical protein
MHPNHHQKNQLVRNTHAPSVTNKVAFLRNAGKESRIRFYRAIHSCGMKKTTFWNTPSDSRRSPMTLIFGICADFFVCRRQDFRVVISGKKNRAGYFELTRSVRFEILMFDNN